MKISFCQQVIIFVIVLEISHNNTPFHVLSIGQSFMYIPLYYSEGIVTNFIFTSQENVKQIVPSCAPCRATVDSVGPCCVSSLGSHLNFILNIWLGQISPSCSVSQSGHVDGYLHRPNDSDHKSSVVRATTFSLLQLTIHAKINR